jgi:hypothetical protein
MSRLPRLFGIMTIVLCVGCYHATVETGAAPSNVVIHKSFASGWIFGLVPPSTIETQSRCPNGPAKVETQLSFVNQLVSFLTLSIYTPMEIKVTCAAPGREQGAMEPQDPNPPVGNAPSATTPRSPEAERKAPPRAGPPSASARIRTNDELLTSPSFRQAMTDVLRMRIVNGFRELRPDTLTLDLEDEAFTSASTEHDLSRLYLAYRGTTTYYRPEAALELQHGDHRVGLYTQRGLLWEAVR